jgi:hypothetical protein
MDRMPMKVTGYLCSKCDRFHKASSRKGQEHLVYMPKLRGSDYMEAIAEARLNQAGRVV